MIRKIIDEITYWSYCFFRRIYIIYYTTKHRITHKKMYKNPEEYIPKDTHYCYGFVKMLENGLGYETKPCPFHKHYSVIPYLYGYLLQYSGGECLCLLTKTNCCGDCCKDCGISTGFDEY